jgi:TatD DNase family protein
MSVRTPKYFDIHTHQNENGANCITIINSSDAYSEMKDGRFYSAGIHPWFINELKFEMQQQELSLSACRNNVWAIGECGLDKLCEAKWEIQLVAFRFQIQLANKLVKPLIIHAVRSHEEILALLKSELIKVPFVFHGFNKGNALAQKILKAGGYLSFGKALSGKNMAGLFSEIPVEKVFLETDDSGCNIEQVYEWAAKAKSISVEKLQQQMLLNAEKLFQQMKFNYE